MISDFFENSFTRYVWFILVLASLVVVIVRIVEGMRAVVAGNGKVVNTVDDVNAGLVSIIGTRPYQEDAGIWCKAVTEDGFSVIAAVICDGMGGMDHGDVASNYCRDKFVDHMVSLPKRSDIPTYLEEMVRGMDRAVAGITVGGRKVKSGTTLVAALVSDSELYTVSCGDSRIYLVSDGKIRRLTRDHNYRLRLEEKMERGELSREEVEADKKKEALISFVGHAELIDVLTTPVSTGDIVMLCSDGVTKLVSDNELEDLLSYDVSAQSMAQSVIDSSVTHRSKGQDNTTCAIVKC